MKVLIIEDEKPAAEKLARLLQKHSPDAEILATLGSVALSVEWLAANQPKVDLIFADIQLTDGLSFDIFRQLPIEKPVIFTTAFDEYAIEAFKVNSIAYLLKPITYTALAESLQKLELMKQSLGADHAQHAAVFAQMATAGKTNFKERFLVKLGEHIRSVKTEQIALFYAEGRTVFMLSLEGKKFVIDFKMEELMQLLDPALFFRVNRSFLVNINAIADVVMFSNSRLQIQLCNQLASDKEMIVSRDKVSAFKSWFDGTV